jgi:nitrate reductase NapAB chaperone NapD
MSDAEALLRVEIAAEEIAGIHGTSVQRFQMKGGRWIVSIETEDKAVVAEGATEAQALSNLIARAKAEGWA